MTSTGSLDNINKVCYIRSIKKKERSRIMCKKNLIGKTIKAVKLDGYGIQLQFTDGSRFEYEASDGGYSTYDFYKKGEKGDE